MMKNSNLVIGIFIGAVSISQAVKIETDRNYGRSQGYEGIAQIRSNDDFSRNVNRRNVYAQQTGRMNQRQMSNEWDDELLHNVGTVKAYTDPSPAGYTNDNTTFEVNSQTWDEVAHVDADVVKAEGIALAKKSEHQLDTVQHRTKGHQPVEIIHALSQKNRNTDQNQTYDHLHEQTSTISPYTQRDHAWSNQQYDQSHEKKWDDHTQEITHGAYGTQSLAQNQEKLYLDEKMQNVLEENEQLYNENQELKRINNIFKQEKYEMVQAQNKYNHSWETKSLVLPYVARNHAWNFDEHDMTNFPIYKAAAPDGYKEDDVNGVYEEPHPWPMDPNAPAPASDPEDDFKACQAEAVLQFKQARSPDQKREAMKAGARCLGKRCDRIAVRDLLTAADAPAKQVVLDAQTACHVGSGTTENQPDPDGSQHPIQNIWRPTDMYGEDVVPPNTHSHDYEHTRTEPRIPLKSRMDLNEPPHQAPYISDDDREAAKVAEHKARDKIEHKQEHEDLEKRHDADVKNTAAKLQEYDVKEKEKAEEKKEKEGKKEEKKEEKKDTKAGSTVQKSAKAVVQTQTVPKPIVTPTVKPVPATTAPATAAPVLAKKAPVVAQAAAPVQSKPVVAAPTVTKPASDPVTAPVAAKLAAAPVSAQPVAAPVAAPKPVVSAKPVVTESKAPVKETPKVEEAPISPYVKSKIGDTAKSTPKVVKAQHGQTTVGSGLMSWQSKI